MRQFPLAEYALEHWVSHALFENVSMRVQDGIENLFDAEKPHFSRWVRIRGNMDEDYTGVDHDETHPEQLEAAPMYYAAFCGFTHVIEKLIREHPEHVSAWGGYLGTALHAASRRNNLKVVQLLLAHGADVNAPGLWGRTPLLFAAAWEHLEVVRWLLEHGAEDKLDNWTSLHLASSNGHVEIVRFLLSHGADPDARDYALRTSLHKASFVGNLDIARLLLEHGAEVDAEDVSGRTSYQIASDGGHEEIAQLLLVRGAERRTQDLIS